MCFIYVCVCVFIYILIYICVCVYIYIYIYIYTYLHTHTHTDSQTTTKFPCKKISIRLKMLRILQYLSATFNCNVGAIYEKLPKPHD
jgi:hypothetical protein